MNTQIDWREELDSSFGRAPDVPAAHYVVAGHKAVRRRRLQAGAAALATAAVIAGIGWAIAPQAAPRSSDNVANPTSATSTPTAKAPTTQVSARDMPWRKGEPPARANPPNGLEIREGAVVHERRDDLYPGKDTESVALDISFEGKRWWVLLEWDEGGSTYSYGPAGELHDSFDAFVAASTSGGGMFSPEADPIADKYPYGRVVNYGADGIELRPGATIVRRVDNPHDLTPPESSIGLVVEFEGETIWLSLTSTPSGGGGSSENADESGWATFDEWLAADVALQAGNSGLELVTMSDDGTLETNEPGVVIVEHRMDPDLPAYIDASVTQSAIAEVLWEGETWFVLVVRHPGGEDSITTFAASKADGAQTINQFVAFAAARADEGGGLR